MAELIPSFVLNEHCMGLIEWLLDEPQSWVDQGHSSQPVFDGRLRRCRRRDFCVVHHRS